MTEEKKVKKVKKPTTILWVKENGTEITTNVEPANIAHAEKLGWKRAEKK